jgi:hypothetical protein
MPLADAERGTSEMKTEDSGMSERHIRTLFDPAEDLKGLYGRTVHIPGVRHAEQQVSFTERPDFSCRSFTTTRLRTFYSLSAFSSAMWLDPLSKRVVPKSKLGSKRTIRQALHSGLKNPVRAEHDALGSVKLMNTMPACCVGGC